MGASGQVTALDGIIKVQTTREHQRSILTTPQRLAQAAEFTEKTAAGKAGGGMWPQAREKDRFGKHGQDPRLFWGFCGSLWGFEIMQEAVGIEFESKMEASG